MKPTPGPWKAEKFCVWGMTTTHESIYVAATQTGIDTETQAANARLIAQAPALRDFIRGIVTDYEASLARGSRYTLGYLLSVEKARALLKEIDK